MERAFLRSAPIPSALVLTLAACSLLDRNPSDTAGYGRPAAAPVASVAAALGNPERPADPHAPERPLLDRDIDWQANPTMRTLGDIAATATHTEYSHGLRVDKKNGVYVFDCSSMAQWVLKRAAPVAEQTVSRGLGWRPLAADFQRRIGAMSRRRGTLAVMAKGDRRATYEDLLAVPEHLVAEIINGELVTSPRPASLHALASSIIGGELSGPFHRGRGGPGGWVILDEPELHLLGHVLVPDIAGWRRTRMPEMPDAKAFELSPDWACEVLSPSTAKLDRVDKLPIYAHAGIPYLWLVDPVLQTLEALQLDSGGYRLLGAWHGDAKARIEPFNAIELELQALWTK